MKKFFLENQRGFVLVEFIIALPLAIMLFYAMGTMSMKLLDTAQKQAADYVLENEAHDVLARITNDARAAISVDIKDAVSKSDGTILQEITFVYHSTRENILSSNENILGAVDDLHEIRRYTVDSGKGGYHIYSRRGADDNNRTPITGGNFFGDTTVTDLKFSTPSKNVLHIILELQSMETKKKLKFCTSVYMPSCAE